MKEFDKEIQLLREEIEAIKARNKRVEADKAWETSRVRAVFIALATYVLILAFMHLINDDHPFLKAGLSTGAYLLTTLSYDALKEWWLERNRRNG